MAISSENGEVVAAREDHPSLTALDVESLATTTGSPTPRSTMNVEPAEESRRAPLLPSKPRKVLVDCGACHDPPVFNGDIALPPIESRRYLLKAPLLLPCTRNLFIGMFGPLMTKPPAVAGGNKASLLLKTICCCLVFPFVLAGFGVVAVCFTIPVDLLIVPVVFLFSPKENNFKYCKLPNNEVTSTAGEHDFFLRRLYNCCLVTREVIEDKCEPVPTRDVGTAD